MAILFDLDGTLLDHQSAADAAAAQWAAQLDAPTPPDGLSFAQWWKVLEERWFSRFEEGHTTHTGQRVGRARDFLGRANLPEDETLRLYDDYLAAYRDNWQAYPDAADALRRALSTGDAVGILTNGTRDMQAAKIAATGLDLGATLLPTVEWGTPKPDTAAYRRALQELDTPGGVMIGDSYNHDVLAARRAGLQGVLVLREGTPPEGEVAARSLRDLTFSSGEATIATP